MITLTPTPAPRESAPAIEPVTHDHELLFKEAMRRQRRRRLRVLSVAVSVVVIAGLFFGVTQRAFGSSSNGGAPVRALAAGTSPEIFTCQDTAVARPSNFVITCADANSQLTKTHWSTWTANQAVGSTTFAINFCNPYCAASKMSFFPHSSVQFSRPVTTAHGRLFSLITVHYKVNGVAKVFRFSFKGDPSF